MLAVSALETLACELVISMDFTFLLSALVPSILLYTQPRQPATANIIRGLTLEFLLPPLPHPTPPNLSSLLCLILSTFSWDIQWLCPVKPHELSSEVLTCMVFGQVLKITSAVTYHRSLRLPHSAMTVLQHGYKLSFSFEDNT